MNNRLVIGMADTAGLDARSEQTVMADTARQLYAKLPVMLWPTPQVCNEKMCPAIDQEAHGTLAGAKCEPAGVTTSTSVFRYRMGVYTSVVHYYRNFLFLMVLFFKPIFW